MRIATLATLAALVAAPSFAANDLREEAEIAAGLITVGIAIEIADTCPTIGRRKIRGISYLLQLKSMASNLGYSEAEIDDFIKDRGEKARLENIARAQLSAMGATPGDVQSYCAVGTTEIGKGSMVGYLLR